MLDLIEGDSPEWMFNFRFIGIVETREYSEILLFRIDTSKVCRRVSMGQTCSGKRGVDPSQRHDGAVQLDGCAGLHSLCGLMMAHTGHMLCSYSASPHEWHDEEMGCASLQVHGGIQ